MDKVLAFSILSASPADIAAGADLGVGGRWTRLSWRSGTDYHPAKARPQQQQREQRDRERPGSPSPHGHGHGGGGKEPVFLPRFALEFDGIDCFETIVSH